ncbi:MAG: DNA-directed DNA polymerase [Nanoarchaeota archaeon]|nr:DNA-directed DNA polymerase [Nanoarchaeota archaeon]MBU1644415.1 DNA-directed DNA polymerase [Nanoarchaeota archaeon]MBU1977501.1 DNA-directed DNA polymerase [Nanoarchaeota archaeon]
MELQFYPYDFDYKVEGEKTFILLFSKLENEKKVCIKNEYKPYFYASLEGVDQRLFEAKLKSLTIQTGAKPAKVTSWEEIEKELLGQKKLFYKISVNYPKAVPVISREVQEWGVECYEKDILFTHRYLRDKGITPMVLTKATGKYLEEEMMRVPVFLAEEIIQESKQTKEDWKILAIDIETYAPKRGEINPKKNPILMIAFYGLDDQGKEFRKVITWKIFKHNLDYLEIVKDEFEMLERFKEIIWAYDPDIITGYFSDGFDFPYIHERAEKNNVKLDLGLDHSELFAGSGVSFQDGESKIKGILHLDVFKFIRNIFGKDLKIESYSLDAVSEELLGHRKHQIDLNNLAQVWDKEPDKLEEFCKYNLQDASLTFKLCDKLIPDMVEFTSLIALPTFDLIRMKFSRLVQNYIMKRAIGHDVLAPNKPGRTEIERRMEESIQGAFVYEPTPGLYEDIVVFDFRSLYPTIITAHNIGPESFRCSCCKDEPHVPDRENYWFCKKERRFIPSVLEELIIKRVELKNKIKELKKHQNDEKDERNIRILEARSYALKILANSFYGYLGFYGARWYCLECAASTTAYARNYIKKTIEKAEKSGFQVIYADTDSCFLLLGEKCLDEAMSFMDEINKDLPGRMELEFEGLFPRGLFVALKGSEKGAKKKYALISKEGKIKITGFESVRRNWSALAKEVQRTVLRLVLQDKVEEAVKQVKEVVKDLKKGNVSLEKLILKTQITRELSQYSSIGPHVKVANDLVKKGFEVLPGTVVEYIIVKGSGLVRERARMPSEVSEGEYDCDYYIKNQLIPAVSSILAVLGYSEEDLFDESSQTGLGNFF